MTRVDTDAPWCSGGLAGERLDQRTWVIVDTETSGLNVQTDEVREFAAVVMDRRCERVRASYEWKADEGPEALREIARRLRRVLSNAILVAHNLEFDLAFLRRHEATRGTLMSEPERWLCTMKAAGGFVSLDTLATRCGVVLRRRHSASGDVWGLAEVIAVLSAAARDQGATTVSGIRDVATLRCQADGGQSGDRVEPWASILASLPRIVPIPFPTPEQRAMVAAIDGRLKASDQEQSDPLPPVQASQALRAAQVSATSLELMLVDSGRFPPDT